MACFPLRYWPAVLMFLSALVCYLLRLNINMAIIPMTANATTLCTEGVYSVYNPETEDDIFCWSDTEKSLIKGIFYYGYIFLQIPGGRLSEVYGTKRVLGYSTMLCGILALFTPMVLRWNVWYLVLIRGLTGFLQGVLFPSLYPMIISWSLESEVSTYGGFSAMGGSFGVILIYPLLGYILKNHGWEPVFYTSGITTIIWCFFWFFTLTDDPKDHPLISPKEKDLILRNRVQKKEAGNKKWPICQILTSKGVRVLIIGGIANDYGLYMLLTEGPQFLTNVMKKNIEEVGTISSFPYLGRFIMALIAGYLADSLIARPNLISKLSVRKLAGTVAFLFPALGLSAMSFLYEDWVLCVLCMISGLMFNGFIVPFYTNILDIAPSYTGTVMGIINASSSIVGFFVPMIAMAFTQHDPSDPIGWRYVFFTTAALYIAALLLYLIFGTVEKQAFELEDGKRGASKEQTVVDEDQIPREI